MFFETELNAEPREIRQLWGLAISEKSLETASDSRQVSARILKQISVQIGSETYFNQLKRSHRRTRHSANSTLGSTEIIPAWYPISSNLRIASFPSSP